MVPTQASATGPTLESMPSTSGLTAAEKDDLSTQHETIDLAELSDEEVEMLDLQREMGEVAIRPSDAPMGMSTQGSAGAQTTSNALTWTIQTVNDDAMLGQAAPEDTRNTGRFSDVYVPR